MLSIFGPPIASSPPSSSATAMCSAIVDGMPFWAFSSATLPSMPSAEAPLSERM
jgi:hypothetical protein